MPPSFPVTVDRSDRGSFSRFWQKRNGPTPWVDALSLGARRQLMMHVRLLVAPDLLTAGLSPQRAPPPALDQRRSR